MCFCLAFPFFDLVAQALDGLGGWNGHLLTHERADKGFEITENQLSGLEKFAHTSVLNPES